MFSRADVALFVLSAAILTLEVLQTRIFAFSLDALTIYFAVAVCLLGLGGAGTLLALLPPPSAAVAFRRGAAFAAVGAVAVLAAHVVFARGSYHLINGGPAALPILAALAVPYLCFGLVTTMLLMTHAGGIGRAYAVNLAGSGLGCLIVFPLLDHLGAERALVAVAGLALGGALVLASLSRPSAVTAALVVSLGLAAATATAPTLLRFRPDPQGQLSGVRRVAATLSAKDPQSFSKVTPLLTRWDRTARVDVNRVESTDPALASRVGGPLEVLLFSQDASAGSILLGVGDDLQRGRELFERTVYGAAYMRGPVRDVLVIGLGGAPDVLTALYHGATHIDGVEINRATIDLVRNDFRTFLGNPYGRPEVRVHHIDGRTFLKLPGQTYDVIQLSGADTKAIFASGSLSVNENYLYTREAMRDLLRRLNPDGMVAIIRFGQDVVRLTATAVAALRDLGVSAPERHLFAVRQGKLWTSLLVKRSPFTGPELSALYRWVRTSGAKVPDVVIPAYDWLGFGMRHPLQILYSPPPGLFVRELGFGFLAEGRFEEYVAGLAAAGRDLSPPVDDRPFFFFKITPAAALRLPPTDKALALTYRLVGWLMAIAAVLILVPLLVWRGQGLRAPDAARTLVYFACLGAAFMLVEIGLIHRFVLLLGHQSYAITVVIFGLLAGAGAGSLASARLVGSRQSAIRVALAAAVVVIFAYAFGLAGVLESVAAASFPTRLAIALALLVGLGFCLGVPFPSALRTLEVTSPALVAWAVGINGFASVVGATVAVPLAMIVGLRALLLGGGLLYGVALLATPRRA